MKLSSIFSDMKQLPVKVNYRYPGLLGWMKDETCIKFWYKYILGKKLDLENPKTFNEKLQWLKLHDRKDIYTTMVDKYEAKKYVADMIGEGYIIPTLGVWNRFEDIDFDSLPDQFVLKCTHDSGGLVICRDKSKLDKKAAKKRIKRSLKKNFFLVGREWPYKNVRPRIIAEKLMTEAENSEKALVDYKFYCFGGKVDSVMLCMDRETGNPKFYFFDKQWNLKRYNKRGKSAPKDFTLPKPKNMDEMFEIAEVLSQNLPFVRVDLYNIQGKIYFGELTFFPDSGFDKNRLPETDLYFGSLVDLKE